MSYVRVITEPLYIIITMAIPRNTSVHVQSKKALQEALDGFVWTLTNAESHGTTHTQKPEEIKAGEIEAQFNGAVNHFHRYQREYTKSPAIRIGQVAVPIHFYFGRFLWNVYTLLGMNPYTSKSGSGESGNASSKPSSRLVHDKEYFADLVGVDVKTCELQMTFLRQLNKAAKRISELQKRVADAPRSETEKKVFGHPLVKFLGAVAYSLIWHIAPSSVGLVALIGVTTLAGLSMSLWRSVGLSTKSWWSGGFLVAIFATFMLLVNQHFHSFLNLPFTLISQYLTGSRIGVLNDLQRTFWAFGTVALIATYLYGVTSRYTTNKFRSIMSATTFDWWMLLRGTVVTMAVMAYASLPLMLAAGAPTVIWSQWAILAIASTVIIAVQSLTEELMFRRFLCDFKGWQQYALTCLSSLIFAVGHLGNPEFKEFRNNAFMTGVLLSSYFSFGLSTAILTVICGGLELSWALHLANNLFLAIIVGYTPSPSESYPLYLRQIMDFTSRTFGINVESLVGFSIGTVIHLAHEARDMVPVAIVELFARPHMKVDKINQATPISTEGLLAAPALSVANRPSETQTNSLYSNIVSMIRGMWNPNSDGSTTASVPSTVPVA